MNELVKLTLADAREAIARKTVSSLELTQAILDQIDATEPMVKAFATVQVEAALREARLADDALARGMSLGALHGIPIAVKDVCDVRGIACEAGSRALKGNIPAIDARVVDDLRSSGAIIIGKTVTHEFAVGVNTPPTRNPWNRSFYPGGSSVGSAVSIAVRSSMGAIGTDSGGSIRIPASINGIVGLKPTFGLVSTRGVFPMSSTLDHVGPMARTVEDCAILLGAIATGSQNRRSVERGSYVVGLDGGIRGLRIGVERSYTLYDGIVPDVAVAFESALRDLQQDGAVVRDVVIPEVRLAGIIGLTILLADTHSVHRKLLPNAASQYDRSTRQFVELGGLISGQQYIQAHKARCYVNRAIANAYADQGLDVLVSPTVPIPSVRLGQMGSALPNAPHEMPVTAMTHNTYIANVTGQPAMSIPCGFSNDGLPIGLQVMGRPFGESTVLRVGRAYERAHPWAERLPSVPG